MKTPEQIAAEFDFGKREPWSDHEADHAQEAVDLVAAPEGACVPGNHHTIMIDECPNCQGGCRMLGAPSKWGDGSPTDFGPCQVCGGSGELEQEFECRTLDDLEAEGLLYGELPPL